MQQIADEVVTIEPGIHALFKLFISWLDAGSLEWTTSQFLNEWSSDHFQGKK